MKSKQYRLALQKIAAETPVDDLRMSASTRNDVPYQEALEIELDRVIQRARAAIREEA